MIETGNPAPDFALPARDGSTIVLSSLRGHWVVLYFYPKDNTPGCTLEAVEFSALKPDFEALGARILGVSPDSAKSHCGFAQKQSLTIQLLSDSQKKALMDYGAWGEKVMCGKKSMGVIRSTFLIDPSGTVARTWPKVSAKGHATEVLETLRNLASKG